MYPNSLWEAYYVVDQQKVLGAIRAKYETAMQDVIAIEGAISTLQNIQHLSPLIPDVIREQGEQLIAARAYAKGLSDAHAAIGKIL